LPAVRGMRKGKYITDSAQEFLTNVDDDYYQNTAFKWTAYTATPKTRLPRGFRPRHVTGLSATTGRRSTARVPDITADIWTGVSSSWTGQTNIGGTDTYTVVDRIAEKPSL
jgi:hypothetical protein